MTYIENLNNSIAKRSNKINYNIKFISEDNVDLKKTNGLKFPFIVKQFYENIEHLRIDSPRHFVMLPLSDLILLDGRFLWFSTINKTEKICFDVSYINDAGQWDIINYNNGYLITRTITSYLINKIWAWIDKGRKIWDVEVY